MALTNYISLRGDKLVVSFRFDPEIVATVKGIDGRLWNKDMKQWEIPKENVGEVLKALEPLGFVANLDVKRLKQQEEEFLSSIDTIRATEAVYEGPLPLFDFQRKGASFLKAMPAALLADVPGLGKSIQTLAATEHEEQVLIFVPASLKYNWEEEIKKWLKDSRVLVIDGNKKERTEQWLMATDGFYQNSVKVRPKFVIANYELLLHDLDLIKAHEWPVGVCDEATRISNPDAQTTKNLKSLKIKKKIALTGTPISNRPTDIFSIIDWLVPRYLGSFGQFRNKYCQMEDDWGTQGSFKRIIGYKNMDQLRDKVGRFMIRRLKEEVFTDFPPKMVEDVVFQLSPTERKLYQSVKEEIYAEIHNLSELDTRTLNIIPVKMLRLKQCTGHTRLIDDKKEGGESSKLATMKEMLGPIIASGEKAIIFTQFSSMLHILYEELKEFRPLVVYGETLTKERMVAVTEFNHDPKGRIIIMTEAGAYGLNMQTASYVFHYDFPWSIAKLQQREDRAHRHGVGKKGVTVYNMIAKDTIDEYVMKTLHKKQVVSVDILADVEKFENSGLSEADVRAILRL